MKDLTLNQIKDKLKDITFPKFDLIIGIATDGIKPAELLSDYLNIPFEIIHLNYRNKENIPIRDEPIETKENKNISNLNDKNILIVDSISKTSKTLNKAKDILKNNNIKTFVINGKADYFLFNYDECINWPW